MSEHSFVVGGRQEHYALKIQSVVKREYECVMQ